MGCSGPTLGNRLIGKLVLVWVRAAPYGAADFVGTNPQGCASLPLGYSHFFPPGRKQLLLHFGQWLEPSLATKIIHAISLEANPSNGQAQRVVAEVSRSPAPAPIRTSERWAKGE